jgi:hypothetical protein
VSVQPEQRATHAAFNTNSGKNNANPLLVGNTFSFTAAANAAATTEDLFLDSKFQLDANAAPSCGTGLGALDPFAAFAHGAFDATFSNQLFSFDDYLHDPTSSS